jgi:glycosyltransferase involved in cell wall biosynthesis
MRLGIDASNIRAGGGLTHLLELLRAAEPQRHGVTRVVVWAGRNAIEQLPDRPWLERIHDPMLDRALPWRRYWQAVKLPRLAERHCDLLFVPGGVYGGGFRPFITMSHNLLPFELAESRRYGPSWMFIKMLLLRWGQAKSFRRADGVIFLTEYARSVVKRVARLNGCHPIIPHGVNQCFYLPPREQKPLNAYSTREPFKFLYVSKIEPYKHQWRVVEAVARLRRAGLPVALDLIGGPECPSSTRRLIKAILREDPVGEFIHYLDHIPYSELPGFYHRSDGFIFASSCENLPNILLEAMASGLPIACSRRGPLPEILGEAGRYFDPERSEEIAEALRAFLNDTALRERLARQAYHQAQLYSWDRCARETFSYFAEVAQTISDCDAASALTQTALQNHN